MILDMEVCSMFTCVNQIFYPIILFSVPQSVFQLAPPTRCTTLPVLL